VVDLLWGVLVDGQGNRPEAWRESGAYHAAGTWYVALLFSFEARLLERRPFCVCACVCLCVRRFYFLVL